MKIISKFSFVLISAICTFAFTSCEDSSEEIISISETEAYQLQNPSVKVTYGINSATVEINFAYPSYSKRELKYYSYGGSAKTATVVSQTPTKDVYKLSDLKVDTEYYLYFSNNEITYLIKDGFKYSVSVSLPNIKIETETIYSSPIAVKGGLDSGWTQIDTSGHNLMWESVVSAGNQEYGGIGYAAYLNRGHTWLISPKLNLEAGKEYTIGFYGYSDDIYRTFDIYINKSNDLEEILLTKPHSNVSISSSKYEKKYSYMSITFTPETSGYYYCAFYPSYSSYYCETYITGFRVKTIKH